MLDLTGKVAVITGAARGVGRSVAIGLGGVGARVVIAGRSTSASPNSVLAGTLEETADSIRAAGGEVVVVPADVSTDEGVEAIRAATLDVFGRCDVLVNNAAVAFGGAFAEQTMKRWRKVLEVNLLAPIALVHAFLPELASNGGVALSYSSRAAVSDEFGLLPYSVSKVGLERLTMGLAAEGTGARFVTLRIDDVVPTEAVSFHGGPVQDDALQVEDVVEATLHLVEHAAELDGTTVSLLELNRRLRSEG